HILIGAGIGIMLVVPLGAYAFVKSGLYNVAASHPHTAFTEWLTHDTMIHSVRRRAASVALPATSTPAQVVRGFCQYDAHFVAYLEANARMPPQSYVQWRGAGVCRVR